MVTNVKRGQRAGVPEVPLDLSGPIAREIGKQSIMSASEAGDLALEFLNERHAGSRDRVARQVEKGLRTPEFYETEAKLTDNLYSRAKPLYKQAYAENPSVKEPPVLKEIFNSPDGKKAVNMALRIMQNQGKDIGKKDAIGMVRNPSLEFLDNLKKGFDTIIRREEGKGGPNSLSHSMKSMRSKLITYLDNPENVTDTYQKARKQYKGDLEVLQAMDLGRNQFYRMPAEEARLATQNMSFAEKQALKTGFSQWAYDVIYAPSTDTAAARRLIGSPEMARRFELLFDKPREFRLFKAAMEREMDLWEKSKKIISAGERGRGSRQAKAAMDIDDPLTNMKGAISNGPLAWTLRTIGWGRGKGLTEKQANEAIRILTTGDVKELDNIATQLEKGAEYSKKRGKRKGRAALAGTAIGAGIGCTRI